jgi:phage-related protein
MAGIAPLGDVVRRINRYHTCASTPTGPDSMPGRHDAGSATCFPYKILYTIDVADSKPVEFRGSSLEDLRAFPLTARREAGHQLDQVQNGREPDDWKPMNTVGQSVKEIRIRDEAGTFRVLYVAKFADAIYVLHCFQKKTEKTSKADVELAAKRYREVLKELGQ